MGTPVVGELDELQPNLKQPEDAGYCRVSKASIVEAHPTGYFEHSTLDATRGWGIKPGCIIGQAVAAWVALRVRFRLIGEDWQALPGRGSRIAQKRSRMQMRKDFDARLIEFLACRQR